MICRMGPEAMVPILLDSLVYIESEITSYVAEHDNRRPVSMFIGWSEIDLEVVMFWHH